MRGHISSFSQKFISALLLSVLAFSPLTSYAQLLYVPAGSSSTSDSTAGGVIPGTFTFQTNINPGNTLSPDVSYLQYVLNSNSATAVAATGAGSDQQLTNYYGSLTEAAVMQFQSLYRNDVLIPAGLTSPTGTVGAYTRKELNIVLGKLFTTQTTASSADINYGNTSTQQTTDTDTTTNTNPEFADGKPHIVDYTPLVIDNASSPTSNSLIYVTGANFSAQNTIYSGFGTTTASSPDGSTMTIDLSTIPNYREITATIASTTNATTTDLYFQIGTSNGGISPEAAKVTLNFTQAAPPSTTYITLPSGEVVTVQQYLALQTAAAAAATQAGADAAATQPTYTTGTASTDTTSSSNSSSNTSSSGSSGAGALVGVAAAAGGLVVAGLASAVTSLLTPPFGGTITQTTYCTCSGGVVLKIQPPAGQVNQNSLSLLFQLGASTLYAQYNIYTTGVKVLGLYTYGAECLVYQGEECNTSTDQTPTGTILKIGTGAL